MSAVRSCSRPLVDKSLTYELFGYNITDEEPVLWSPEKLAVFLTRKFNTDMESSLLGRIIVAPENDFLIEQALEQNSVKISDWKVSTATIVEGILRLITTNPKIDSSELLKGHKNPRSVLTNVRIDRSPLRSLYLECNDVLIYTLINNYFIAVNKTLWSKAQKGSFITKTIGLQALFDVLKNLCAETLAKKDISVEYFEHTLSNLSKIDFSNDAFRNTSGAGRANIKKFIEAAIGKTSFEYLIEEHRKLYLDIFPDKYN